MVISLACCILLLGSMMALAPERLPATQGAPHVLVLTLEGIINPPAASYVERWIDQVERSEATAVVLELDTPGGLDSSTRQIVQAIDNAGAPVIVFVAPQGARAASAGTFIAMASHVAVMAPGTTIGSATPVSIGAEGQAQDLPDDLRNKIINEAASYIRAHAELRGRNADWAEKAVREGANLSANEAEEQGVVEFLATDLDQLLASIEGMQVKMGSGEKVTIRVDGLPVHRQGMGLVERFLHTISNPNVAFILLSIAMMGIFIELGNPGLIFPGVTGGIALLLALYALGTLNAFWGGILLILLAFALLVSEAFTPTYGLLGAGGIAALVVGGMMLFADAPPGIRISSWPLGVGGATAGGVMVFYLRAIVASRRGDLVRLGYQSLVGDTGVARTPLVPEGTVFVQGERWRGHSLEGDIEEGIEIVVERRDGMELWVRRHKGG